MTFFVDLAGGIASGIVQKSIEVVASKNRNLFINTFERMKDGSLGIFIFGPQGTGKTTLMNVLSGSNFINDVPTEYSSSNNNEKRRLGGHIFFKVHSGPGQEALSDLNWPDLFKEMGKYKRVVCIFCCSYGHHTSFDTDFDISKPNIYFDKYLSEEARIFSTFCERLSAVGGKIALMLLVTKQDLWWNNREEAKSHYDSGEFAKAVQKLSNNKKASGFSSSRSSVSLSIQNLLSAEKQIISPTIGGYDQLIQKANYSNFVREIEKLISKLK